LSGTIGEVLEAATWDKERERWDIGMPTTFFRERIQSDVDIDPGGD